MRDASLSDSGSVHFNGICQRRRQRKTEGSLGRWLEHRAELALEERPVGGPEPAVSCHPIRPRCLGLSRRALLAAQGCLNGVPASQRALAGRPSVEVHPLPLGDWIGVDPVGVTQGQG
jgi:hypothetical protein